MKRALVLSGGGSRGAYEIGAWQAFEELGIKFDAVYGTSIGAINAALVAQGDLELAKELWKNITLKQVFNTGDEEFSVEKMISRKRDVIPFLLENAKHLNADITPLENMIGRYISEGKVRASGMELGVMTVRIPQLQPAPVRLKEIPQGQLADWLIASASCFPVFPTRKIDGERYVDGGYFDNLPIDMAIADGAEEIVAVDIHPQPHHTEYAGMPFLKMIHPLRSVGNFLDFDPEKLGRSRRMGYYDVMKAYGAFDGIRYTFTHVQELKIADAARRYMQMIAAFDAEAITRNAFKSAQEMNAPLISALERETPTRKFGWKDVYVRGLELCAESMGFREDAVYEPETLLERIENYVRKGEKVERVTRQGIALSARMGKRELLSYLYRGLGKEGRFPEDCTESLQEYPAETAGALFLHAIGTK